MFRSGLPSDLASCSLELALHKTASIILKEEINDMMKIIKSFEESGLLIKGVSKTIKMKQKNNKKGLHIYYCNLSASLLGNLVTAKDTVRAGKGSVRAC